MLYLSIPTKHDLDGYYKLLEKKIADAIKEIASNEVKTFLTPDRIKLIIQDEPKKLLNHHMDSMKYLINKFNDKEYTNYIVVRNKKKKDKTDTELIKRYQIVEEIFKVFNYTEFISGSKSLSYKFAAQLKRNTCTYCNRLYTQTIITGDVKTGGRNNSERITRPEFDHWFPKYKYPILSLSYYNLIPSCSVCNSSVKSSSNFTLDSHTHPYIKESGQEFTFSYHSKSIHENNVILKFPKDSKIANTLKDFKTGEIYNAHSNLELKDLLELKYKYSENYLDILLNRTFTSIGLTEKEAYRLIFGIEIDEEKLHKRPLSKFKKEIIAELLQTDKKNTLLNE